jgi:hypothetical protein
VTGTVTVPDDVVIETDPSMGALTPPAGGLAVTRIVPGAAPCITSVDNHPLLVVPIEKMVPRIPETVMACAWADPAEALAEKVSDRGVTASFAMLAGGDLVRLPDPVGPTVSVTGIMKGTGKPDALEAIRIVPL